MNEQVEWETQTPEEKKRQLYLKQKHTLDTFLEHGAITRAQYNKSLGELNGKMEIKAVNSWDKLAADFQRTYSLGLSEYNSRLLSFWRENGMIFPGCRAIDIGCGVGKYGAYLAASGCDVTLTDISPEMIRLAEKNLASFSSPCRTYVCNFDDVTGREPQFREGFDFAISTMSPAIHNTETVMKMSSMTDGWCFIARFSSWNQPNRDKLLNALGIKPKRASEELTADVEEMIAYVTDSGFLPQIKYVEYNWCDMRSPEEAAEYMQSRYTEGLGIEVETVIEEVRKLCGREGLFEDSVNTDVAWIYWNTKKSS